MGSNGLPSSVSNLFVGDVVSVRDAEDLLILFVKKEMLSIQKKQFIKLYSSNNYQYIISSLAPTLLCYRNYQQNNHAISTTV